MKEFLYIDTHGKGPKPFLTGLPPLAGFCSYFVNGGVWAGLPGTGRLRDIEGGACVLEGVYLPASWLLTQ